MRDIDLLNQLEALGYSNPKIQISRLCYGIVRLRISAIVGTRVQENFAENIDEGALLYTSFKKTRQNIFRDALTYFRTKAPKHPCA